MEADLYKLLLSLTLGAAEQMAWDGRAEQGLQLHRDYRTAHGDFESRVTDAVLRYALLHIEGPQLKALQVWDGRPFGTAGS